MKKERPSSAPLPEPSPVEYGGRVELRLTQVPEGDEREAVYAARWFTAELSLQGEVSVSSSGTSVEVEAPEELPDWLGQFTTTLVRTTARTAAKESAWPRRLTRWRKAPDRDG